MFSTSDQSGAAHKPPDSKQVTFAEPVVEKGDSLFSTRHIADNNELTKKAEKMRSSTYRTQLANHAPWIIFAVVSCRLVLGLIVGNILSQIYCEKRPHHLQRMGLEPMCENAQYMAISLSILVSVLSGLVEGWLVARSPEKGNLVSRTCLTMFVPFGSCLSRACRSTRSQPLASSEKSGLDDVDAPVQRVSGV